jgi:hypothetical protein
VVDVGDDGDVAYVFRSFHKISVPPVQSDLVVLLCRGKMIHPAEMKCKSIPLKSET